MSCNLRNCVGNAEKFLQCFDSQSSEKSFKELWEISTYHDYEYLIGFLTSLKREDILALFEEARHDRSLDWLRDLSNEKLGLVVRYFYAGGYREQGNFDKLIENDPELQARVKKIAKAIAFETRGRFPFNTPEAEKAEIFQYVVPEFLKHQLPIEKLRTFLPESEIEEFSERVKMGAGQEDPGPPPAPGKFKYAYPRSLRAKTNMRKVGALPSRIPRANATILGELQQEDCPMCIEETMGLHEGEIFIPVTHYSTLRSFENPIEYTMYYYEPDSEIYLRANRVFIDNNKASFCYRFRDVLAGEPKFEALLKELSYVRNEEKWAFLMSPEGRAYEGFQRDLHTLDQWISHICLREDFDCVIFSNAYEEQYHRNVTEILDARIRQESFDNLFYLD